MAALAVDTGPDELLDATKPSDAVGGETPGAGIVPRVAANGAAEAVECVFVPHGLAVDGDGDCSVALDSSISGPKAPPGRNLRFDRVGHPPGHLLTNTSACAWGFG